MRTAREQIYNQSMADAVSRSMWSFGGKGLRSDVARQRSLYEKVEKRDKVTREKEWGNL